MSELILHHYNASPFTQRVLRMLGIKRLTWKSVITPMLPPKDDLVALTGGYRGTPVLQIGADVYVDSQRIARELERRFPSPSLFPDGNAGVAYALVKWADAFFRSGLNLSIALGSATWPAEFRNDRQKLFPDIDFDRVDLDHAKAQYRAHASFVDRQLADGRAFLTGSAPGLVDLHAWTTPWFTRAHVPIANELLAAFRHLSAWERRIADLGEGERLACTAAEALEVARNVSAEPGSIDPDDAQGFAEGLEVDVMPDDTMRGAVRGRVVATGPNEIAVCRSHPRCGEVVVHFPRLGYRVVPVSASPSSVDAVVR
jgi:glutathione S-transferase